MLSIGLPGYEVDGSIQVHLKDWADLGQAVAVVGAPAGAANDGDAQPVMFVYCLFIIYLSFVQGLF